MSALGVRAPMSTAVGHIARDTSTMVARSLRLSRRNPDELVLSLILPVLMMMLFAYIFGGSMAVGSDYVTYVTPGVILLCAGFGAANTAITINNDITEGIMDRFRSMPVSSGCVLAGHVLASVCRNLLTTVLVIGVAAAVGFRATANIAQWAATLGIVAAYIFAITCVAAFFGVIARTPAAAGGLGFVMLFLPYVSSGFAPPETMPAWLRGFTENQPVTPVIEAARGFTTGLGSNGQPVTDLGTTAVIAMIWCTAISVSAMIAATCAFRRRM